MSRSERPFLDFYEKHSIIPTFLEVTKKKDFFEQRNFLLATLGIPLEFIKSARIFELGPGTGQKTEHLLSLSPKAYVGVENNEASIKQTLKIINQSHFEGPSSVRNFDFLDYEDSENYDFVLAELVVPTQREPSVFLEKLINLVSPNGFMIYNCIDPISMLSETLRRAIVNKLGFINDNLDISSKNIVDFFSKDLDLLPGMNRERSAWAIDQIIKPAIGPMLSIPESLDAIADKAVFHGSSPRFVEDYRWYKDPSSTIASVNNCTRDNYWRKCHNFIDFRHIYEAQKPIKNRDLFQFSQSIYSAVVENEWSENSDNQVTENCEKIFSLISQNLSNTAGSLKSFLKFWRSGKVDDLDEFRPWWGRGTQYVSVIKLQ